MGRMFAELIEFLVRLGGPLMLGIGITALVFFALLFTLGRAVVAVTGSQSFANIASGVLTGLMVLFFANYLGLPT